jgi:predicted secreted protein
MRFLDLLLSAGRAWVLGACLLSTAAAVGSSELTEKDDGQTITAKSGQVLTIRLPAQMGTGFGWQLVANVHFKLQGKELELKTPESSSDHTSPGSYQIQVFRMLSIEPGTSKLRFEYRRPWEPKEPPQKIFEVTVEVKD